MTSTPLGRLRRYQDLLLLGGGVVITFVAFLTFAVTCVYALRQYAAEQRQHLADNQAEVVAAVRAAETSLRRTVSFFELSWPKLPPADAALYDAFRRNGNRLFIASSRLSNGVYVAATERAPGDPLLARRYLALAQQFELSNASASAANDLDIAGYIYSPYEDLIVMPASAVRSHYARPSVAELIEALRIDFEALATRGNQRSLYGRVPVYWLPAFTDPLTGHMRVRLAARALNNGETFAVVVIEYDPLIFLPPLSASEDDMHQIVDGDGRVIASLGENTDGSRLVPSAAALKLRRSSFFGDGVEYGGRYFIMRQPIADTDWTLLCTFSWDDVLRGVARQVGTAAVATAVILVVVWTLLLMFRRRIFTPLLKLSERVFESENLSRTVIHTVPVGLALISRETGEWLLGSPHINEIVAHVVGQSKALADALLRAYAEFERDHSHGERTGVPRHDLVLPARDLVLPMQDGGHIELACSASPARFNGIDVLVAVFIDVTRTRRLQRELNSALQAADSANQAKSAFLAAMSHEIRTPLNAILGNLELLANSRLTSVQRDRLATVRSASDGLLAVISDVLDFSKIEAGEMALEHIEFNVLAVIERVLEIFAPLAKARGLDLYARLHIGTAQTMWGDPTRAGQVLNNLISNAIKFTERGAVTVIVHTQAAEDGTHQLVFAVADTGIGISPEHREQLFKAFSQLDASINRRFGGTGLGLALCLRLVHAMQGRIDVSSTPGVGSRFTVHLPLGEGIAVRDDSRFVDGVRVLFLSSAEEWRDFAVPHLEQWGAQVSVYRHPAAITETDLEAATVLVIWGARDQWRPDDENRLVEGAAWVIDGYQDGPAQPISTGKIASVSCLSLSGLEAGMRLILLGEPLPEPASLALAWSCTDTAVRSRGLKVLVAEDNAANRLLLVEQLASLGCRVAAASNGRQALEQLDDNDWDVLLTDLNMPGMSGYQLVEAVRKRKPALSIMAITAHATKKERQRCEAAGLDRVMTKPVSLQQLSDAMESVAAAKGVKLASSTSLDSAKFRDGAMPKPLWDTFLQSTEEALSLLEAAQASDDVQGVLAQLHSMRGALAVFGQASLAADCAGVEAAIKRDRRTPLPDELNALKRSLRDLLDAQA